MLNLRTEFLPTADILVEAKKVGRVYAQGNQKVIALAEASCRVVSGDRIALVGASGSGKSTLLHLMAGLEVPTSGQIDWAGLGARETLRPGKVAFVFQMPSLLAPLTVVENVELPMLLEGTNSIAARKAAMEAIEKIHLTVIAHKLPEELSGGQMQRVAVARALASCPRLILADEPTGQLDQATAQQLFDVLLETLEGTNTALVVATHDLAIASRLTQMWQMQRGYLNTHQKVLQ